MHKRVVITIVTLTLGLLLATSDAADSDVIHSIPTIAVLPQEKAGSAVAANSGNFLSSMSNADDGEYVIFNSKGDPEAAVVVTKDAAKATEESNIRSIYEWMQRYMDKNKNTKAVTSPSDAPKKSSNKYRPEQNYAPQSYGSPPPPAQYQYDQYTPVSPYTPYRPESYPSDARPYRPESYYEPEPNNVQYQYGLNQGYPQELFVDQRQPPKIVKQKKPYVEISGGANKRPLHVYNVEPIEYPWAMVQTGNKHKNSQDDVIRGAHTTPNGKPWPPARKLQKKNVSARMPFFRQNQEMSLPQGYMRFAGNMANNDQDSVSVERYPIDNVPQVVSPNQNMFYRSWLAGQISGVGSSPFYGSDVNYDDQALSAYLLSKFAPFMQPQAYRVKSVVKSKKKNNTGAKKGPVRYITRKQLEEMVNGKKFSPRPQYYSMETVDAIPQTYSRYGAVKDGGLRFWQNNGIVGPSAQQAYTVEGLNGIIQGNTRFDALKAMTGYTKSQIDQMMDGVVGNEYMNVYSPQDVEKITKNYGGAQYSTGYDAKNYDSLRRANFPQLYLFPSVDSNTQTLSLYGGVKQQVATPNGYMDVMRNINTPPSFQMDVPTPDVRKFPNQQFMNPFAGYGNEMVDQSRNVDYSSLFSFMRGMNGISGKSPKVNERYSTTKAIPQYFTVDAADNVGAKYDNVRALNAATKAQIAKLIANNLKSGGMRYREQSKYAPSVEPWQQFRNSERSYSQYNQPWGGTFAMRAPVTGYGY